MRIFKTKPFARFAKKAGISDATLCGAIRDVEQGLVAADLGGGVIKQRIARRGQGKSAGFRVLLAYKAGSRAILIHGFAKNESDNIAKDELTALKLLAGELLAYDEKTLRRLLGSRALTEVQCDQKAVS